MRLTGSGTGNYEAQVNKNLQVYTLSTVKQSAEAALKTDRDVSKISAQADASSLRSAGASAKTQSKADMASNLLSGVTTLTKNNAFDPEYYKKK